MGAFVAVCGGISNLCKLWRRRNGFWNMERGYIHIGRIGLGCGVNWFFYEGVRVF